VGWSCFSGIGELLYVPPITVKHLQPTTGKLILVDWISELVDGLVLHKVKPVYAIIFYPVEMAYLAVHNWWNTKVGRQLHIYLSFIASA
jgi:hypothetical protein